MLKDKMRQSKKIRQAADREMDQNVKRAPKPSRAAATADIATRPIKEHEVEIRSKKSKERLGIHDFKTGKLHVVPGKEQEITAAIAYDKAGLDEDFANAVRAYAKAHQQEKAAKATKVELAEQINVLLEAADEETVSVDEYLATRVPEGTTHKFNKEICAAEMLKAGLKAKTVEKIMMAATEEGKRKSYVLVTDTTQERTRKK